MFTMPAMGQALLRPDRLSGRSRMVLAQGHPILELSTWRPVETSPVPCCAGSPGHLAFGTVPKHRPPVASLAMEPNHLQVAWTAMNLGASQDFAKTRSTSSRMSPWQNGKIERVGGVFKEKLSLLPKRDCRQLGGRAQPVWETQIARSCCT